MTLVSPNLDTPDQYERKAHKIVLAVDTENDSATSKRSHSGSFL